MTAHSDLAALKPLLQPNNPALSILEAMRAGVSRSTVRRLWDHGYLQRVGKSSFVLRSRWESSDPWERFRLMSLGFVKSVGNAYLTGPAAALLHGIPVDGPVPEYPVAVRPGDPHRGSIRSAHGRVRHGYLPPHHRSVREGVPVVSTAYAMVDIARHGAPIAGLMAADFVLHRKTSPEAPAAIMRAMRAYPGIDRAQWALTHADPRCESPLETLGRYAFLTAGRQPPLSNVWISYGGQRRRVDHLLPEHGVVVEGDGAVKYNDRSDAAAIIDDEKERHRWLQQLDFSIVRYNHAIARFRPHALLHDVDIAVRHRAGRRPPDCWSLDEPWAIGA